MSRTLAASFIDKRRNHVINGNFDFWQRGTTKNIVSDGGTVHYLADRFRVYNYLAGGTLTHSRSTDVPNALSTYSAQIQATATVATPAASEMLDFSQWIEGNVLRQFAGKPITLSFWVKAWAAGVYSVAFYNSAGDRCIVKEYTVTAPDTWEFKTITLTHDVTGTWRYDTGRGMKITWYLAAGGTGIAPNVWVSSASKSSNQTNQIYSASGNTWKIAQVMLNEGSVPTQFFSSYEEELRRCQRYFEKSYDPDTAVGTAELFGSIYLANMYSAASAEFPISYKVTKRTAAALMTYSPVSGTAHKLRDTDAGADVSADYPSSFNGKSGCIVETSVAGVVSHRYNFHWTADAEL